MPNETGEAKIQELIDAVHKLTLTAEQVAISLANMIQKQEEDRIENKERQKEFDERQKKWDEEQEVFKARQKKWDETDARTPWASPRELAIVMMAATFLMMSIAVMIAR